MVAKVISDRLKDMMKDGYGKEYIHNSVRAVIEDNRGRIDSIQNDNLTTVFGLAQIFVKQNDDAYKTIKKVTNKSDMLLESLGIIGYELDKADELIRHFAGILPVTFEGRIAMVLALEQAGKTNLEEYRILLEPISQGEKLENTILGITHFNNGDYERADNYFEQALEIEPLNKELSINLLRAKSAMQGEIIEGQLKEFYERTRSFQSIDGLLGEIRREKVDMPEIKQGQKLYKIISGLLLYES